MTFDSLFWGEQKLMIQAKKNYISLWGCWDAGHFRRFVCFMQTQGHKFDAIQAISNATLILQPKSMALLSHRKSMWKMFLEFNQALL